MNGNRAGSSAFTYKLLVGGKYEKNRVFQQKYTFGTPLQ